jgi:hypothetical protein
MRRLISLVSALIALVALGLVLYNATTLDRRAPEVRSIALSAPEGDDHVAQTLTAIDIEFSEPVVRSTAQGRITIEPPVEGAITWDGPTAIFTPSHELPADTTFVVRVAAGFTDLAGNASTAAPDPFTFRTVGAPVVLRATPADGTAGVALDGTLELIFDRLMDTASVEAALQVEPALPVTATWSGSVVSLAFGDGLRFGTTYTVTLGPTAADTGGTELGAPFVTHFTTAAAGLPITSIVPAAGVAGIAVSTPIAVTFAAPIDPATARSALHITPGVGGGIRLVTLPTDEGPVAPSAAPAPQTILFEPSGLLAPNTTYTVTLDPTVARLGEPTVVAGGRTWSFTTGSPTASGQNQIAFLSARGGVRNVWVMNPDGTNQRQLTAELTPVSSFDTTADGRRVVYASAGIVTLETIDGRDLRHLTVDDGRREYGPVFAPDDAAILVGRRDAAGTDLGIWIEPVGPIGGEERQVLDHGAPPIGSAGVGGDGLPTSDGTPVWMPRAAFDPTGRYVLFAGADGAVVILDLAATPPVVVKVPLRAEAAGVWVPTRQAFVTAASDLDGANAALYTVGPGGTVTPIAGTEGAAGPAAVGADGSLAVLRVDPGGRRAVEIVSSIGSVRLLVGLAGHDDRWPAFSPGGETLIVGRTLIAQPDRSDGIWLVEASTGASRQLSGDGAYGRWIP